MPVGFGKPVVWLTGEEIERAERIADERHRRDKQAGIKDSISEETWSREHEIMGVMGEMVVGIVLGMEIDEDTTPRAGSVDFIKNGLRIEVKSTGYKNGWLGVRVYELPKKLADVYVLVTIQGNEGTVIGWTTRDAVGKAPIEKRYIYPCHAVQQEQLYPMVDFPESLEDLKRVVTA